MKHSPKSIHLLRIVLSLTCVFQIVLACCSFFNQNRFVTSRTPIEIWSYGPCRYQEPWICYVSYQMLQLSALAGSLTSYGTFYLKYKVVKNVEMTKIEILKTYFLFYCPFFLSIILVIIIITTQTLAPGVQEHLELVNANVQSEGYATIAFLSFSKIPNTLNLLIYTFCILMVPMISLYCRNKILRQISNQIANMSWARQMLYKNFVMGLTIQCVLPYVFYVPIYSLYYYCLITKKEVLFLEFFLTFLPTLPSLVDPLISLYFVTPFRRKLVMWTRRSKSETRTIKAFTL